MREDYFLPVINLWYKDVKKVPRYRSCKNCPAYKYRDRSRDNICLLNFQFEEKDNLICPLQDCLKPKNITELHINARKLGIELIASEIIMSEHTYELYKELRELSKAQKKGDNLKVAEYMSDIIQKASRGNL